MSKRLRAEGITLVVADAMTALRIEARVPIHRVAEPT
jgi:hypothetical protein